MRITRSRTHHVSMGNYEWYEFSASVEDEINLDLIDLDEDTARRLDNALDILLATEVDEARQITAEKKSYINLYKPEEN